MGPDCTSQLLTSCQPDRLHSPSPSGGASPCWGWPWAILCRLNVINGCLISETPTGSSTSCSPWQSSTHRRHSPRHFFGDVHVQGCVHSQNTLSDWGLFTSGTYRGEVELLGTASKGDRSSNDPRPIRGHSTGLVQKNTSESLWRRLEKGLHRQQGCRQNLLTSLA